MDDKRVLVVDDDPGFAKFVGRVATKLGYEVRLVTRSEDIAQAYQELRPTTIVLDVVMPDMDGIELLKWLAERQCTARLIVVTGYNADYARFAEMLGKANGLRLLTSLTKPMSLADLRDALAT